MLWSDQNTEELKRRWIAGESCSEIAAAMHMTRNAIIGKAHRLELADRRTRQSPQELEFAKRRHAEQCAARKREKRRLMKDQQMEEAIAAMPVYDGSLSIPFADLRDFSSCEPNQCRFIADEPPAPEYRACGNETRPGEPYCAHCRPITRNKTALTQPERAIIIHLGRQTYFRAQRQAVAS